MISLADLGNDNLIPNLLHSRSECVILVADARSNMTTLLKLTSKQGRSLILLISQDEEEFSISESSFWKHEKLFAVLRLSKVCRFSKLKLRELEF